MQWTQIYDPFGRWWLSTLVAALPIYTLMAVRRVFAKSWMGAVLKALGLCFVYCLFFMLTIMGILFRAALELPPT